VEVWLIPAAGKETSMNGEAFFGDLRKRIVRAVEAGRSRHAVARMFEVSASCVIKLMRGYRETGAVRAVKFGGYRKPILTEHEAKVRALVAARPDMTISELASELAALGIKVGRSSVYRFLRRLGLTLKKNAARRRTAPARHRRSPRRLAKRPGGDSRSAPAGVHRRDLGLDQHDAPVWPP
jgi:transposase